MEAFVLTFAELEFLLPTADSTARKRLHLRTWNEESGISECGLASLVARGLVTSSGGVIEPIGRLAPLLDALTSALAWVEIGIARETTAGGVQIFDGTVTRIHATALPFGTFGLTEVNSSIPFAESAADFVRNFLSEDEAGAAVLKTVPRSDDAAEGEFAVRRSSSGEIQMARGAPGALEVTEVNLDAAVAGAKDYLRA